MIKKNHSRKRKIAVIGLKGLPAYGGASSVGEALLKELHCEYDFTVFSTSSHTLLKSGYYNGLYQRVFRKIPLKKLNTLYYYIRCALCLLVRRYDLVHWHHSDAAILIPLVRLRQKVLLTTHGAFNVGLSPKWEKYHWFFKHQLTLVKYANKITCVSLNEQRLFLKIYGYNVTHIPNGINARRYHEMSESIPSRDYILFAAGRLMESKGVSLFIDALNKLEYRGRIIIAGAFDNDDYKSYILQKCLDLNVQFVGLIKDKQQLFEIIYNSKLFVYPTYREAMSMMMLEVASVKTPMLCSDIQENRDVFSEDEVTFFETENINSLKKNISNCLKNYPQIVLKAENAFDKLCKDYDWANIAKCYKNIYDVLMK